MLHVKDSVASMQALLKLHINFACWRCSQCLPGTLSMALSSPFNCCDMCDDNLFALPKA